MVTVHAAIIRISPTQLQAMLGVPFQVTGVQSDPITHIIEIRFDDERLPPVAEGATPTQIDVADLSRLITRGEL